MQQCIFTSAKSQSLSFPSRLPLGNHKSVLYVYESVSVLFSSVQLLSHIWLFATPWIAARQASLSITNFRNLLKLMSVESVMPSNHLILCRLLLRLPSIFPRISVFSIESVLCLSFGTSVSASVLPMNIQDWFPLGSIGLTLAIPGTPKSLLQHHSSKASTLWQSAFSCPYITTVL